MFHYDTTSLTLDTYQDLIQVLKACGGNCDGREGTNLCNSFQDFTLIRADEFQHKIQDLSDKDEDKLLYALDQVGIDKLHGSESALKEIHLSYKKWKSSISKRVMEAANKGTVISDLLGGTKSVELEKTAISPKIMSQWLNQLQEEELESRAKEYEKFKTGKTMDDPNSFKGFSLSHKSVQKVNLAMFGKNLIEGVLNQNADSVIAMGKLLGVDRSHNQKVEMAGAKGTKTLEAAEKILGATLKAAGPFVGSASNGISIYSFVEQINQLKYLQKFCQRNDSLVQDRLKSDCKFDLDSAIAKTVADKVENVNDVAAIGEKILALFGKNKTLEIVLGVFDVLMEIGAQIDAAVKAVNKISSSLVGGLNGWEGFVAGWRSFFGMGVDPHIGHLLDIKKSYNTIVSMAVEILKNADKFQTYVVPTTHTFKVNCRMVPPPVSQARIWAGIFSLGISEVHFGKKKEQCDFKQEFQQDSVADFQNWQQLRQFRVEPDAPWWGHLECKPSTIAWQSYGYDPEYVGFTNGYLCHNVIAVSAPQRSQLPVLVDLKAGNDHVLGFTDRKHVFLVEKGYKEFTGGSANDVFVIKSFPIHGQLDGAGGINSLVLDYAGPKITFDLSSGCQTHDCVVQLKNLQQIIGRPNLSDEVVVSCSTTYVDLNAGVSQMDPDKIEVPGSTCKASSVFQLRSFTTVENNHQVNGVFTYQVEFGFNIHVRLNPAKNLHRFIFSNDVITADFAHASSYLSITNNKESKSFQCTFNKSTNSTTMMTEAGLSVNYDQGSNSFFGLASITNGIGELKGLVNYPNRFIVATNGAVNIKGGDKNDIFMFAGSTSPSGLIDGSGGVDSLVIQQDYQSSQRISINFTSNLFSSGDLKVSNIQNIFGRARLSEIIEVSCDLKLIDLRGGSDTQKDIIRIPPLAFQRLSCTPETTLIVRNFTTVQNFATNGAFNYRIDCETLTQTNWIQVNMEGYATHTYTFLRNVSSVRQVKFNQASKRLEIHFKNANWMGIIPVERSTLYLEDHLLLQLLPQVHGVVQLQSDSPVNVTCGGWGRR